MIRNPTNVGTPTESSTPKNVTMLPIKLTIWNNPNSLNMRERAVFAELI